MSGAGCLRCGAALEADGGCRWCGAPGEVTESPPAEPQPETVEDRLDAFRRSAEYARLARPVGVHPPARWHLLAGVGFGLLFAGVAISMISFRREHFSSPFFRERSSPLDHFPVLFVLVGVGIALWNAVRYVSARSAPIDGGAACIVGRRSSTTGGQHARTEHFVGIELPSGERQELRAAPHLVSTLRDGDIGVAFIQAEELIEFRRARGF